MAWITLGVLITALVSSVLPPSGRELAPVPSPRMDSVPAGVLRGIVLGTDPHSPGSPGSPLEGVRIDLPDLHRVTHSDSSGRFELQGIPPGWHAIVARRPRLGALRDSVQIPSDRGAFVHITLFWIGICLDCEHQPAPVPGRLVDARRLATGCTAFDRPDAHGVDRVYLPSEVQRAVRTAYEPLGADTLLLSFGGTATVDFIVDALGRAEPGSIRLVQASDSAAARAARDTYAWIRTQTFIPAEVVAGCTVRQRVTLRFVIRPRRAAPRPTPPSHHPRR